MQSILLPERSSRGVSQGVIITRVTATNHVTNFVYENARDMKACIEHDTPSPALQPCHSTPCWHSPSREKYYLGFICLHFCVISSSLIVVVIVVVVAVAMKQLSLLQMSAVLLQWLQRRRKDDDN
jgi:hypothetical protein